MKEQDPVYIVSGFPRSGTTMMMQCLTAGGLNALIDQPDSPRGQLYELPRSCEEDPTFLKREAAAGKLVKLFYNRLAITPPDIPLRILFMLRDPSEIRYSLEKHRRRSVVIENGDYLNVMAECIERLRARANIDIHCLTYRNVISDPRFWFRAIKHVYEWPIDYEAAAGRVKPELCHFKKVYREARQDG